MAKKDKVLHAHAISHEALGRFDKDPLSARVGNPLPSRINVSSGETPGCSSGVCSLPEPEESSPMQCSDVRPIAQPAVARPAGARPTTAQPPVEYPNPPPPVLQSFMAYQKDVVLALNDLAEKGVISREQMLKVREIDIRDGYQRDIPVSTLLTELF